MNYRLEKGEEDYINDMLDKGIRQYEHCLLNNRPDHSLAETLYHIKRENAQGDHNSTDFLEKRLCSFLTSQPNGL